jgi:hypothetical protein
VEKVKVSFMDKKATVTMKIGTELTEEAAKQAVKNGADESGNTFELTSFKKMN